MTERPVACGIHAVPAGLVLAGGRGERLGGEGKHTRLLGGRSLLERAVERLAAQVERVLVSCNDSRLLMPTRVQAVLADTLPGRPGPLAGVLAGLEYLADHREHGDWLLSVPVDTPWFPEDLSRRLAQACSEEGVEIAVARSAAGVHPVFALWPVHLAPLLRATLERGDNRSVRDFQSRFATREVWWDSDECFHNINTPEDLAAAESRIRAGHA